MYVTAIEIEGLRAAPAFVAVEQGRVVDLPPGPLGVAVADALGVLVASLDAARTRGVLLALGLAHPADDLDLFDEDGLPSQFRLADPGVVGAWVDLDVGRQVTARVALAPDPPFFGRLRELAVREPRLVTALGEDPDITLKVGWTWSQDLGVVAVGLSEIAVGGVAFPGTGAERPSWLAPLLKDVARRLWRADPQEPAEQVVQRLHGASLSHDPVVRARYGRAVRAVAEPPFALGALSWVRCQGRVEPRFGAALLRARQLGRAADEALRLVEAVHLRAPDVLVVEAPGALQADPAAVRQWLAEATEGDDATLEQVFRVPGGGP